jgi:Transglycosylase SLT domain
MQRMSVRGLCLHNSTCRHTTAMFFLAAALSCALTAQAIEGRADLEATATAKIKIPLPPVIEGLVGLPQTFSKGRSTYLDLLTQKAHQAGLPPALADAVIKVESSFNPHAVGGVGEVGLMQVRPETAAMLGYKGGVTGLFEPETNVHYGVAYLARAWQLAKGDVCRALMKYRAGWGEERMSPLSVEYCRRARGHLASIGSPFAEGALPTEQPAGIFSLQAKTVVQLPPRPVAFLQRIQPTPTSVAVRKAEVAVKAGRAGTNPLQSRLAKVQPTPASVAAAAKAAARVARTGLKTVAEVMPPPRPERLRLASAGPVKLSETEARGLQKQSRAEKMRKEARRKMWNDHDARMDAVLTKAKAAQLNIMAGAR